MNARSERRPELPALNGLRFVAALHIYLFHIVQAHVAGVMRFPILDKAPDVLLAPFKHGYISTGLFFALSGFLLTYVYVDDDGRLRKSPFEFIYARLSRLYPLYLASLIALAPAALLLPFETPAAPSGNTPWGLLAVLTLSQSWHPSTALSANAPAWAMSAIIPCYAAFPWIVSMIARLSRGGIVVALGFLALLSIAPAGLYLWFNPENNAWSATPYDLGGAWLTTLRFHPLVWFPQFVAGAALGRLRLLTKSSRPAPSNPSWFAVSDGAWIAFAVLATWADHVPYVLLRHGLLLVVDLLIIWDLSHNRGLAARLLGNPIVRRGSEAALPLFVLQLPIGAWFAIIALRGSSGDGWELAAMILVTVGLSLRIGNWMSQRRIARSAAPVSSLDCDVIPLSNASGSDQGKEKAADDGREKVAA